MDSAISGVLRGLCTRVGLAVAVPAQFVHRVIYAPVHPDV
jgi:hypothetical protein